MCWTQRSDSPTHLRQSWLRPYYSALGYETTINVLVIPLSSLDDDNRQKLIEAVRTLQLCNNDEIKHIALRFELASAACNIKCIYIMYT